ncbi:poly-gamma-glutamate biosynthesis protein [Halobiforma lacisalsi AJ5]|uniref:Capsule synthesis protein, CapA n=1 Tax=Natronobacterium lacisalsi AJ5 TaxID=358396 RepID=M0LXJ8_NATLA|nr:CapA family protein [Halobiforma lacisalsi]APW97569.1 poly-gamma-glutamate biosynthesis protein [Halobiforma lacisalsi AJ5]EMA37049.1 capsule synthesis protein, CapA [Halobiforma lacisalsi AJ5]
MTREEETHRIGFVGDVMLGRLVDRRQRERPPDAVWGTMLERLRELDALVVNLECCLSTRGREWRRTNRPFHFRADPDWAVPALEAAGVDVCALANNHVLDYEVVALRDTLEHLDEAGIARTGAGETIDEALEPAVVTVDGDDRSEDALELAVVSLTDNTREYAADEESPGTAWIDVDVDDDRTSRRVREAIERAREAEPDLLVASLHWGPNMVTEPPDSFREFGRWLVEEGVDLVHGHSAHVFQGIEVHDGRPILYDTGDFVDDYRVDPELRNDRSFLFVLSVSSDGELRELRLEPTEIDDCAAREAGPDAAEWARERIRELSSPFGTEFERDAESLVLPFERDR